MRLPLPGSNGASNSKGGMGVVNMPLSLLKHDLGVMGRAQDVYLKARIDAARREITGMGITLDEAGASDDVLLLVDYAAWLYRKRDKDTGMPRHLQFRLHNRMLKQKAGGAHAAE